MRARRAAPSLARQVGTRGLMSSQLPDLSKLNSVPGPRASGPAAGSTPAPPQAEKVAVLSSRAEGPRSFIDDSTSE